MHNRPILSVPPALRWLSAFTETGGAQAWTVPAGIIQVAFPIGGAHGDALARAGGCALVRAGGLAAEVTATLPVTAGTVLQPNGGQASSGNPARSSGSSAAATDPAGDGGGASDVRTPASSGAYPLANQLLAASGTGGNADSPSRTGRSVHDGGSTLGDGPGRGASLAEHGYIHARFGGVPVLVAPELAAQIRAFREEQP
jgi:hypothetical protein